MATADEMLEAAAARAEQLAAPGLSSRPRPQGRGPRPAWTRGSTSTRCSGSSAATRTSSATPAGSSPTTRSGRSARRSGCSAPRRSSSSCTTKCGLHGASEDEFAQALARGRRAAHLAARRVRGSSRRRCGRASPGCASSPELDGQGRHPRLHLRPGDGRPCGRLRRVRNRVRFAAEPRFGRTLLGHSRCCTFRTRREARALPPGHQLHRRGDDLPAGQHACSRSRCSTTTSSTGCSATGARSRASTSSTRGSTA